MKTIVSVSVDTDVIAELRLRKMNISGSINKILREMLNIPDIEIDDNPDEYNTQLAVLKGKLAEVEELKRRESARRKREQDEWEKEYDKKMRQRQKLIDEGKLIIKEGPREE